MNEIDKLYKLYNIANQEGNCVGNSTKLPCKVQGHDGIFKLPLRFESKDHIMETFCYNLSKLVYVEVVYAETIQTHLGIGAYSRYEVPRGYGFIHFSEVCNQSEMFAQNLVYFIKSNFGLGLLAQLLEILQFDFLVGQLDRHMQNIAFLTQKSKVSKVYKLYDNGICLYSHQSEDNAIQFLHNTYFAGRMGDTTDLLEAMHICKVNGIRSSINIQRINKNTLYNIFNISDKFNELSELRKQAMVQFILNQKDILMKGRLA